jgi:hypothetical protein
MTTIGIHEERLGRVAQTARGAGIVRRALVWSGILSLPLYVATDVIGGMRYAGYNFASQAISELMAVGAPSKSFVDPLFLLYSFLALAFGTGVFRAAGNRNRALRTSAAALIAYGAIGAGTNLAGEFFAMQQRGAGSLSTDAPHIILTAVLVFLLLLALGFGAFSLGMRFRVYSLATLVAVIVFGALTAQFAPKLAAGQPTPGLGIVERIDVYAAVLWVAVLGIALLRHRDADGQQTLS